MPRQIPSLTLADARALITAGEKKAEQLGVPYNIAVVDAGGGLIAHVRMDGAWLGSIDISIHKAWTARAFDMSTEKLAMMAQSGKPLFGIDSTNHDKVVIFGGGIPVKMGDTVIGALGASGGTVDQDLKVAEAAASAFGIQALISLRGREAGRSVALLWVCAIARHAAGALQSRPRAHRRSGVFCLWQLWAIRRCVIDRRVRQIVALAGWLIAASALLSPLCALSVALFSARVAQHMILVLVAAPLIGMAWPRHRPQSTRAPYGLPR